MKDSVLGVTRAVGRLLISLLLLSWDGTLFQVNTDSVLLVVYIHHVYLESPSVRFYFGGASNVCHMIVVVLHLNYNGY